MRTRQLEWAILPGQALKPVGRARLWLRRLRPWVIGSGLLMLGVWLGSPSELPKAHQGAPMHNPKRLAHAPTQHAHVLDQHLDLPQRAGQLDHLPARAKPEHHSPILHFHKTPQAATIADRYADLVRQGMLAMAQHDWQQAQQKLQAGVVTQPRALPARLALAELWLQQQRWLPLAHLLDTSLRQHPDSIPLQTLKARYVLATQGAAPALAVLKRLPENTVQQQPDALALQAALQYQSGAYRPAAASYQHLLQANPNQATYWLGLAMALEQLTERPAARIAYQHILQTAGTEQDALRQYATQHLAALQ